jgi:DNA repair exonuclease SbcCD ATPase subunit
MDSREVREERIGLGGAAAILGRSASTVRRYVAEGRLHAERTNRGGYSLLLSEVEELARMLGSSGANDSETSEDEEVFEGEVIGDETFGGNSRLPAVPFERYERLLQQGQDYKTRLEERTRQIDEVRQ